MSAPKTLDVKVKQESQDQIHKANLFYNDDHGKDSMPETPFEIQSLNQET